jgi:hypothetical protein
LEVVFDGFEANQTFKGGQQWPPFLFAGNALTAANKKNGDGSRHLR